MERGTGHGSDSGYFIDHICAPRRCDFYRDPDVQEGKSNGLGGAIGGIAESYWSKNKGRSMEGTLEHFTRYGAIVFMIITLILNILLKVQG